VSTVARPASLEQQVDIETPEQVIFSYTIAGVGSRAAAVMLDYLIISILTFALFMLFTLAGELIGLKGKGEGSVFGSWAAAFFILFVFAVQWGYFVAFEAFWDGQTPGKRRLGLRVVQDGGYSVSVGASAVRNVMRVIDMQPGAAYAVGIVSAAMSKSGKRLGDMAAGTMVVQERVMHVAPAPASAAPSEGAPTITAALTEQEYELLERYLARRSALDPERRRMLSEQLETRFAAHVSDLGGSPLARLTRLYDRETEARARGVAARGAIGAEREKHAIVARNAARWSAFASKLEDARRRGLRSMSDVEVSDFVAEYREVASDLARLRTASAGRDNDALFYVSRLVGAGHNLIYRRRAISTQDAWRFVSVSVPREVRRSWRPILFAAALLFGPALVSAKAVIDKPELAEEGVARQGKGEKAYIRVKDFERPLMASAIIANNVQVTFLVFAGGISAGILTVQMLVYNGVSIGAVAGLYAARGIFSQIGMFVVPHSVLELSAICIAGGGGFLLAAAMLLPGALTRRAALVVNGRRAIRLITATTMMLIVAGTLEGLLSPRVDVPDWTKFTAAAASALLMLVYFTRGGAGEEEAPPEENAYSDARALISR